MKKYFCLILSIFVFSIPAFAQTTISDIAAVLSGKWQINGKQRFERWEHNADMLEGLGFNVDDGLERIYENLQIKSVNGKITYIATVAAQNDGKPVHFTLTGFSLQEMTFENPDHDFPKKITYKILSPGKMEVAVTGDGGKGFTLNFTKSEN